jgi:hypothetical protein
VHDWIAQAVTPQAARAPRRAHLTPVLKQDGQSSRSPTRRHMDGFGTGPPIAFFQVEAARDIDNWKHCGS